MKILTISFTNHTARYLHFLEEHITRLNRSATYLRCSVYPSSHQYYAEQQLLDTKLYNVRSLNLPLSDTRSNLSLYHERVLKLLRFDNYIVNLLDEEKSVGALVENLFKTGIDKVILIGDSRLPVELAIKYASMRSLDVLYIEQAPFNRMIFDFQGVNRNVSFKYSGSESNDLPVFHKPKTPNFWSKQNSRTKYKYLIYDWYYLYGFAGIAFLIGARGLLRDLYIRLKIRISSQTILPKLALENKVIFFPMQMPVDVQSVYHSLGSESFENIVLKLLEDIPDGVTLLIKEHPNWVGKQTRSFYRKVSLTKACHLVNGVDIKECLNCSDLILTVNSTVGLEALNYGKQVYLMGDAYYRYDSIVHGIGEDCTWKSIVEATNSPKSRKKISGFLLELNEYLIEGHYLSETLTLSQKLEEKLKLFLR